MSLVVMGVGGSGRVPQGFRAWNAAEWTWRWIGVEGGRDWGIQGHCQIPSILADGMAVLPLV